MEQRPTTQFNVFVIILDLVFSWTRMLVALGLSILFSLTVGILAARNKRAESIIVPLLDVFQSIPILGFFPLVMLGVVSLIPGQMGVNLAVIILIFTSMSWNIAFGVYEAVKAIPQDYIDLSKISQTSSWHRITSIYIPASLSRIAYNTQTSWAVGLFYLASSEIISLGKESTSVQYGIGVAVINLANNQDWTGFAYAMIALIIAVIVWQFVFLREFALWSERYKFGEDTRGVRRDTLMRFYSWINQRSISKLFLLTQGRGVTRFSSSLSRFRKGVKYAVVILVVIFIVLELGAMTSLESSLTHLPSLSVIANTEGSILVALAFSFVRVWYVYFICIAIGLPLGISIALNRRLYDTASPMLEVIASIPAPLLLPVLVEALYKNGEAVAAVIVFLGTFWYIIFNIMAGVRSMPSDLFELKREFKISNWQAWRNIYIPATVTAFVTGSITAIGAAWNTLIVAEYFQQPGQPVETQVQTGIGKTIALATLNNDPLVLTLAVLSMTALIIFFNLTVWRRVYHHTTKKYAYNR
ncbi:MAG: ABC transporter permease subunit [Nitrososphaerota archaeon]|nr:ABC transporter permease subunit [Nitrososphaerota archaeon]